MVLRTKICVYQKGPSRPTAVSVEKQMLATAPSARFKPLAEYWIHSAGLGLQPQIRGVARQQPDQA